MDFGKTLRFAVAGAINTSWGFGTYCFFIYIGTGYFWASLFSIVLGVAFSFLTHSKWVFNVRGKWLFVRYIAGWAVVYVFAVTGLHLLVETGFDAYTAGLVMIIPNAVFGYAVMSLGVFRIPKP
jgi:putative flippase GtrA